MPNKTLLRKTLLAIKKNPKHWDQSAWKCGTSFCFAGWAVKLDGGRFPKGSDTMVYAREDDPADDVFVRYVGLRKYNFVSIDDRAHRILKLKRESEYVGHPLFHRDNTLNDLEKMVDDLTNPEDKVTK